LIPVTDQKSLIKFFSEKEKLSSTDLDHLYQLFYGGWPNDWEKKMEETLMDQLGLVYENQVADMENVRKGDVAKLLVAKKGDNIKYIRKAIVKVHPEANIQITRVNKETPYVREKSITPIL